MRKTCLCMLLAASLSARGQDNTVTIDEAVQFAQQWAADNLDEDVLKVLQQADQEKVRQFLAEIQKQFHGEYVLDLAQLRDAAKIVLPILESHAETRGYAAWVRTRLDYLETAQELRLIIPPPKTEPGKTPSPLPNPSPEKEREVWTRKLSNRPWPVGASNFVTQLKPVFTAEKVPAQLVWIAEVESSFNPDALSPAGAAGLFQLMPATAKQYGLRTWPFDQRLDSEPSARAAAKHLRHLHGRFQDWRLAVAAYNAGEGTVQRLLKQRGAKTYDAIATRLPAETQMYVPKVEATLLRREGVKLTGL